MEMIKKLIMYISAFLPMLLIMWLKEIITGIKNILTKPYAYTWQSLITSPYLIAEAVLLCLILLAYIILMHRNKKAGAYTVKIISVNNRSAEYYLSYYSFFILTLIGFSLTDPVDLIVLSMLLVLLGIVYIKNDLFFMNPTINIFRSYIYEVEYEDNDKTFTKLIISPQKIYEGNIVDVIISDSEFTFLRRKHEQNNQTTN